MCPHCVLAAIVAACPLVLWRKTMIANVVKAAMAPTILFLPVVAGLMVVYVVACKTIGGK
jgi:hypothetical protein